MKGNKHIPGEYMQRLRGIAIIERAESELDMQSSLNPETAKDLENIGIEPKQYITEFQTGVH